MMIRETTVRALLMAVCMLCTGVARPGRKVRPDPKGRSVPKRHVRHHECHTNLRSALRRVMQHELSIYGVVDDIAALAQLSLIGERRVHRRTGKTGQLRVVDSASFPGETLLSGEMLTHGKLRPAHDAELQSLRADVAAMRSLTDELLIDKIRTTQMEASDE